MASWRACWSRPSRARELKLNRRISLLREIQSRPSRARELKLMSLCRLVVAEVSRPSRARELKRQEHTTRHRAARVAPLAGA